MPDALPPVGVLLATLDPATTPLAGTEETFIMQGGQPKRTPVSSIGGGGGGGGYSRSGAYTPTVTSDGSATVAPVLSSGYSRVGNGAGVPLAGDTVTVFGAFVAEGLADGDVVLVSLPFQIAFTAYPWCAGTVIHEGTVPGIDVTEASFSGPDGAFAFAMGVSGLGEGSVSFTFTYQTANAVDP